MTSIKEKLERLKQRTSENLGKGVADSKKEKTVDERFWKPTFVSLPDEPNKKQAEAIVRFIPPQDNEDPDIIEFERVLEHTHFIKHDGKFFVSECLKTIGKDCPICAAGYKHHQEGDKEFAKAHFPQNKIITNVYIVKDPANRENEGKVFLYQIPLAINNILDAAKKDDDEPSDVYNFEEGSDVKITASYEGDNKMQTKYTAMLLRKNSKISKIVKDKDGKQKYQALTDEEFIEVVEQTHSLYQFIDPTKFQSPEQLKAKYDKVFNSREGDSDFNDIPDDTEDYLPKTEELKQSKKTTPVATQPTDEDSLDDDDLDALFGDE
jgi:hypothetical protein